MARQAEELTRRGHQVSVVTHAVRDAPAHEATEDGIAIDRTESQWLSRIPGLYQNPDNAYRYRHRSRGTPAIRTLISEQRPDVVLAQNWIVDKLTRHQARRRSTGDLDPP